MCGIVGIASNKNISKVMLDSIRRLEYRGYDSVGMVCYDPKTLKFDVKKGVGNIETVNRSVDFSRLSGSIGITHTRWSTHGPATENNSHPHFNPSRTIFAVHNGIIENYDELRSSLQEKGYKFITETDTEIIPHYFDDKLNSGIKIEKAIQDFFAEIIGTFAILLLIKGHDKIYALKRDSPLALGISEEMNILASDIYAFNTLTKRSIFFEDDEYAVIDDRSYHFYDSKGKELDKPFKEITLDIPEKSKDEHAHFMIKEIVEQPYVARRLIDSFDTTQKRDFDRFINIMKKKKVIFLCCGTSYHASLIGVCVLKLAGISARSVVASEWENFIEPDKDTFVIAISQSGETMDVVKPLKYAKKKGATIGCIVNVPFSTIQRLSDVSINILAGPEIAVASTKAFTNMNITLLRLANLLGYGLDLKSIPDKLSKTLELRDTCKRIAKDLYQKKDIYILGRHFTYPIARELALKFKEVDYIHAEGMMAGELKHGTLALIEKDVPVFSLIYNNNPDLLSNTQEVKARGAKVYLIGNKGVVDFKLPDCDKADFPIYSTMVGHLLSYEIGVLKGVEIDQCRNLAKSVTVL